MGIRLFYRPTQSGVGRHADGFLRALQAQGAAARHVDLDNQSALAQAIVEGKNDDTALFFVTQDPQLLRMIKGKKILWCAFESTAIPSRLRALFDAFDEIWTPSQWGQGVMAACGINPAKLRTVPEGIDTNIYAPQPRLHRGFVFLSVAKYEKRKAVDEIIRAFTEEFGGESDVALWLKPDFPLFPERVVALKKRLADDARIKILEGYASDADMAGLYNSADAFVFPSRAEGFGLPGLEALCCGLPLIATAYSGQTEYLETIPDLYQSVAYTLADIVDADFDHFFKKLYAGEPYGQWAEPDPTSLRVAMRSVYRDREGWKQKASQASLALRATFDWRAVVDKAFMFMG